MKPLVFIFLAVLFHRLSYAFASFHYRDHRSDNRHSAQRHSEPRVVKFRPHLNINAIRADGTIRERIDQQTVKKVLSDNQVLRKINKETVKNVLGNKDALHKFDTDDVLEVIDDPDVASRIDTPKVISALRTNQLEDNRNDYDDIQIAVQNATARLNQTKVKLDPEAVLKIYLEYLGPVLVKRFCINDLARAVLQEIGHNYAELFDFPASDGPEKICINATEGMPLVLYDIMYYLVPVPTKYIRKYIPYALFVPMGLYCLIAITSIVCMWVCCWPCVGGSKSRSLEAQDNFSSKKPGPDSKPKEVNSNEPKAKDAAKEPSTGPKKRNDKDRKYKD